MKKTVFKIIIDIIMAAGFILVLDKALLGQFWHEVAGIALAGLFALHIVLNVDWIKKLSGKIGKPGAKMKALLGVDIAVIACVATTIVSGVFHSESLFPNLNIITLLPLQSIHALAARSALLLLGIHLGFHLKPMMTAFKRIFGLRENSMPRKVILRIVAVAVAVLGVYAMIQSNFWTKYTEAWNQNTTKQKITFVSPEQQNQNSSGIWKSLQDYSSFEYGWLTRSAEQEYAAAYGGDSSLENQQNTQGDSEGFPFPSFDNGQTPNEDSQSPFANQNEGGDYTIPNPWSGQQNGITRQPGVPARDENGVQTYLDYLFILGLIATATHTMIVAVETVMQRNKMIKAYLEQNKSGDSEPNGKI